MKEFAVAKMDNRTKFSSFALLILLPVFIYFTRLRETIIPFYIFLFIIFVSVVFAILLRPKYFLDEENVIIKTSLKTIKIPRNSIMRAEFDDKINYNVRIFGVGGLFGYFGYFNFSDLWYVTNICKKVKIKTNRRLYVISPENPQEFLEDLNRYRLQNTQPQPQSQP